jgi:O-6-methylguanine DNA methyltransferase
MTLASMTISSPIGPLTLGATDKGLRFMNFGASKDEPCEGSAKARAILQRAQTQLFEYFSGLRRAFDLPLDVVGTDFQKKAWKELSRIPYGETISYNEQAKRAGNIKACRAIGGANGRNPLAIIVPCHRVIGADGSLTGFGGGTKIKQQLLALERRSAAQTLLEAA